MTPALAFIRDNAALLAIGAVIVAVVFGRPFLHWVAHRQGEYDRASADADDAWFLQRRGSTHDDCSRDSRGGDRYSNHSGAINP